MKNKICLIGYALGVLIVFMSLWRWMINYHDLSNFASFSLHGLFIILFSYWYGYAKSKEDEFQELKYDIGAIEHDYNRVLTKINDLEEK